MIQTRIQVAIGAAVIITPYIESALLKLSKGDPRVAYKALSLASLVQMLNYGILLPETLEPSRRKSMRTFLTSLTSFNPFAFLKVYFGENNALKRILTIQTLQLCSDGKVTSDLRQLWSRNQLQWLRETIRDFTVVWGAAVSLSAAKLHPYLLKKLSPFNYSTIGNLAIFAGYTMYGLAQRGWDWVMWLGLILTVPGVNSGNAHAIKAIAVDLATEAGYGNGEFAGMANNLRAIAQSMDTVFLGMLYAMCMRRGFYAGTTWWIAGLIGGGLPQLLMMSMKGEYFKVHDKKKAAAKP